MSAVREISPQELKRLIDGGHDLLLIDVREPEEFELVRLDNATLIPLAELPRRLPEIKLMFQSLKGDAVLYCRSGGRSGKACEWLQAQGFPYVVNLRGGINAYAREVDPTLTPY